MAIFKLPIPGYSLRIVRPNLAVPTGRAGTCFQLGERPVGAPVTSNVRQHRTTSPSGITRHDETEH